MANYNKILGMSILTGLLLVLLSVGVFAEENLSRIENFSLNGTGGGCANCLSATWLGGTVAVAVDYVSNGTTVGYVEFYWNGTFFCNDTNVRTPNGVAGCSGNTNVVADSAAQYTLNATYFNSSTGTTSGDINISAAGTIFRRNIDNTAPTSVDATLTQSILTVGRFLETECKGTDATANVRYRYTRLQGPLSTGGDLTQFAGGNVTFNQTDLNVPGVYNMSCQVVDNSANNATSSQNEIRVKSDDSGTPVIDSISQKKGLSLGGISPILWIGAAFVLLIVVLAFAMQRK